MSLTHAALCSLAVKWLKRANSNGGHGCDFAASECRTGWTGEIPDAIGFRASGFDDHSVVVECKTSRSDFLADKAKPHRSSGGVGNFRYYMAPKGIIGLSDLPNGWGLIEVTPKGLLRIVAGHAVCLKKQAGKRESFDLWRHEADKTREMFLLVQLLGRIGNPDELNARYREHFRERKYLSDRLSKEIQTNRENAWRILGLKSKLGELSA